MPRRVLEGKVVSDLSHKTVTVLVERRFMHPVYKKYIKKSSKYSAHDEANHFKKGDNISIIECAPISKTKRWVVMIDGKPAATTATVDVKEKKAPAKKVEEKKSVAKKLLRKKHPQKKLLLKKMKSKF